jgi:thiamine biosynthesis lipoprotein ApbE
LKSFQVFSSLFFLIFSSPLFGEENPFNLSFYSMGTYWVIDLSEEGVSFSRDYLSQRIIGLVDLYDKTFSDWREDSELKALEKNLTKFQKSSDLFFKGLEYSKLGYDKSNGEFDITVGAILWNQKKEKVGFDKLERSGNKFRFKVDPKR